MGDKMTPYDVWQEKNSKMQFQARQRPKLSSEQWDRLVEKMHQSNRVKQSAMIREQNNGLASELGGYLFKPRINKKSLELSATMKSLHKRLPEMLAEREKDRNAKRKESEDAAVAECTFHPARQGIKKSTKILEKMGRKKITPDDLIAYQQEKIRRMEMRRQIIEEVETKECTFKPTVSEKSAKIHEKLKQKGFLNVDPITKTALTSPHKPNKYLSFPTTQSDLGEDGRYEEGPMLVIESEHPYRNNTNEFTTVHIPGAIQYTITFHPDTRTEPVYDFIKFYGDDTHTHHFGAGKYSGGLNGSSCNWPGVGERPPLIIPASKFIINFKTNGSNNDWGFRMHVVPLLMINNHSPNNHGFSSTNSFVGNNNVGGNFEQVSVHTPAIPQISDAARNYVHKEPVHQRLYKHAVNKHAEAQSQMVELMQSKLNISLKPWELSRTNTGSDLSNNNHNNPGNGSVAHSYVRMYSKTHLPKMTLNDIIEDMVVGDSVASNLRQPGFVRISSTHNNNNTNYDEEEWMNPAGDRSIRSGSVRPTATNHTHAGYINRSALTVVEFDEALSNLWKQLRLL
jgi:hypothetical protein